MGEGKTSKVSRRTFMRRSAAAGAGAVALSGLGGAPGAAAAALTAPKEPAHGDEATPTEAVVAYVRAGSSGEVTVMAGEREVVRRDRELARRILRAAR